MQAMQSDCLEAYHHIEQENKMRTQLMMKGNMADVLIKITMEYLGFAKY